MAGVRHDPKNPNAWWVRREDIEEDWWKNALAAINPKVPRRRKYGFWSVTILWLAIIAYLAAHFLNRYSK